MSKPISDTDFLKELVQGMAEGGLVPAGSIEDAVAYLRSQFRRIGASGAATANERMTVAQRRDRAKRAVEARERYKAQQLENRWQS